MSLQAPLIMVPGSLARYPLSRKFEFATRTVKFADFSRQTFAQLANPLGAWVLNLSLLQDQEVADWMNFYETAQGAATPFTFVDPWDNLLLYSEQQENSPWVVGGGGTISVASSSAVADPFGVVSGRVRLMTVSVLGFYEQLVSVLPGGSGNSRKNGMTLTFSTYVMSSGSSPNFNIQIQSSSGTQTFTKAVVPSGSWQRVSLTAQFANTNADPQVDVAFTNFSGTGSVYIFGSQLEAAGLASGYKQTSTYCGVHKCFFATDEFDHQASEFNVNTISQLTFEESN